MKFLFLALCYLLTAVKGHSWAACIEYDAVLDPDSQDYDQANCKAFSRGYKDVLNPNNFAEGTGKYKVNDPTCQSSITSPISDAYDTEFPYATWVPGSVVRLVWPAKNHAIGEECGETSSLDRDIMVIYNPQVNPTSDLSSIDAYTVAYDWHLESGLSWNSGKGKEGIPFANCMDYCSDTDASPCFGDIIVPDFDTSGFYTFVWYWDFGSPYITCFDVYIDVDGDVTYVAGSDLGGTTTGNTGGQDTTAGPEPSPEPTDSTNNAPTEDSSSSNEETESPGATEIVTTWRVQAPMCFIDGEFDEDLIIATMNELFEPYDTTFEMIGFSKDVYNDKFNFTVETFTTEILVVAPTINNGTACDRIVDAYESGSCSVCNGGTIVTRWEEEVVVVDDPAEGDGANARYLNVFYVLGGVAILFELQVFFSL